MLAAINSLAPYVGWKSCARNTMCEDKPGVSQAFINVSNVKTRNEVLGRTETF